MGGGVGVSCHGSHRVVSENAQVSMPECGVGLVPDVGGSLLLARGPGRLGEYLGITAARMGPADAIYAGFADVFVPFENWNALRAELVATGDAGAVARFSSEHEVGSLHLQQEAIDRLFESSKLDEIVAALEADGSEFAQASLKAMGRNSPLSMLKAMGRNSPLSMSVGLEIIAAARQADDIRETLRHEYRFVYRCMEHGDFLEGIRAAIIDKDRKPQWPHSMTNVPEAAVARMRASLGENELTF